MTHKPEKVAFVVVDDFLNVLEQITGELLDRGFKAQGQTGWLNKEDRFIVSRQNVTVILTNSCNYAEQISSGSNSEVSAMGELKALFLDWHIGDPHSYHSNGVALALRALRASTSIDPNTGLRVYCMSEASDSMYLRILEQVTEIEGASERVKAVGKNCTRVASIIRRLATEEYSISPNGTPRYIADLFYEALSNTIYGEASSLQTLEGVKRFLARLIRSELPLQKKMEILDRALDYAPGGSLLATASVEAHQKLDAMLSSPVHPPSEPSSHTIHAFLQPIFS